MELKFCKRCQKNKKRSKFKAGNKTCKACLKDKRKTYRQRRGTLTAQEYEELFEPSCNYDTKKHSKYHIDGWLAVCEYCALDDCVRSEGQIVPVSKYYEHIVQPCAVYQAAKRGWEPEQALENWQHLNLLEVNDDR